eukprot:gene62083-biopygen43588
MDGRPPTKFHPRLKGPYLVANFQGDKYTLRNLVTEELEDFHVTRLREFRYDDRFVDPRDIALRDVEEYYVERILAHSGNPTKLKTLQFHVKWRGFDESYNTWEPWKNLRETEKLHRYLISKGLHKLIPAKFRDKYPECAEGRRIRRRLDPAIDAIQDPETVVNAIGPLSILVPQYHDPALSAAVRSMGLSRTLTPQGTASSLPATEPVGTLIPQDTVTATGPVRTLIPQDSREVVNAMVPSRTLIQQDRTASSGIYGTSASRDKMSKTIQFASVIATYWDN